MKFLLTIVKARLAAFAFLFMFCGILLHVKSDSVCDLNTFLTEVREDLRDNGMLDCLRVIEPPNFVIETEEQKNLRLAAQWDTTCAFEADNWFDLIKNDYKIPRLVDVIGEPIIKGSPNQADLCEILRAAIAKDHFGREINLQQIPESILDKIECAGSGAKNGPQICAANGSSYFQKDAWSIFLRPSVIKISGRPLFVKERPKSAFERFKGSDDKIVSDLMNMGKKALKENEGKLASIIDNLNKNNVKIDPKSLNPPAQEKEVHVHLKRAANVIIKPNDKFQIVDGGLNFKVDKTKLIFSFFMGSYKLNAADSMGMKLNLSGREIRESRQALGVKKIGCLSGAFAEVYNPDGKSLNLNYYFMTNTQGSIRDEGEDNFTMGAISMPVGSVFKHINSSELRLKKTKDFEPFENFELNVNFKDDKDYYFLIFYNISMKLETKNTVGTRLMVDKRPLYNTVAITGVAEQIGNHAARIVKLKQGNHKVEVQYTFDGEDFSIKDFSNNIFSQSMVAFQLPENIKVFDAKTDSPVRLLTKGEWKKLGCHYKLLIDAEATVMILYNVNIKVNNENMSLRLRVGNKFNKKSLMSSKEMLYFKAQGYVLYVLKTGTYDLDLEFKSNSPLTFNPDDRTLHQSASMQIVLFK